MKYLIKATRGPLEPGGLAVSISLELELDDKLASIELGEELSERITIAVSTTAVALNRQFPALTKAPAADLAVEDGDENYERARPVEPPRQPFNEFEAPPAPGPPPRRPPVPTERPGIPPRPVRAEAPRRTGLVDKPPATAKEFLGWLKNRPDEKKYALEIGKAWEIGSWISAWSNEDAISVYNEVSKKKTANGFANANGAH